MSMCSNMVLSREMTKQTNPQKHPRSRLVHIPATATAFGWTKTPRRSDNGTSISAFVVQQKTENLTQKKHKSLGINIPGMGHETNTKTNVVYLSIHPSIYIPLYYMRSDIYIYIYTILYIYHVIYKLYMYMYHYVYRHIYICIQMHVIRSVTLPRSIHFWTLRLRYTSRMSVTWLRTKTPRQCFAFGKQLSAWGCIADFKWILYRTGVWFPFLP
jgi:hypothetical protein